MSELFELIGAYQHEYGATEAAVARLAGVDPKTMNAWKMRGTFPDPYDLARLAKVLRQPYRRVLEAALTDALYLPEPDLTQLPEGAVARRRGRRPPKIT